MSEAANLKSAVKRHWAEPGSRHDAVVRATKYGLPIVISGLILLLAIAPFDTRLRLSRSTVTSRVVSR